jgi:hypothetical protein
MSILDRLSYNEGRVLDIERNPDGTFDVREACDLYFSETLTSDELRQLGEEIIALSRKKGDDAS